jgi:hypothetical protein
MGRAPEEVEEAQGGARNSNVGPVDTQRVTGQGNVPPQGSLSGGTQARTGRGGRGVCVCGVWGGVWGGGVSLRACKGCVCVCVRKSLHRDHCTTRPTACVRVGGWV